MKLRWIILLVVVLVVAGLLVWRHYQAEATVEVISPEIDTIRAYVEEQAKTELPQDYLIAMPIAGWLEPIDLREGDEVKKDRVIAELDTFELEARVKQAQKRVDVLTTEWKKAQDHRLEAHALVEAKAFVDAIDKTVAASEAKLEATRAVAEFAESERDRIQGMRGEGAAASREMREAETAYRKARAELRGDQLELAALRIIAAVSPLGPQFIKDVIDRKDFEIATYALQRAEAEAALEIEKRNLERADITSPIDGIVLRRHQTRRQFLAAGTPLLTLGRLDDIEVIAEVLTERAARIRKGDPVEVYGEAILEGPIEGEVVRVYPAGFEKVSSLGVEQQRVNVAIKLRRRPDELQIGYRVYVRIYYDQAEDVLTLPRTALFRGEGGSWQVMVVEDGFTKLRTVKVGLMNDDDAEIVEGLTKSDQVVAKPSREITEGMRVGVK